MVSGLIEVIEQSIFIGLILSILVDSILNGLWNKMYFTSGLILFKKIIPSSPRHTNIPPTSRFETYFHSAWISSLVFKEIETNVYGFREKFFEIRVIGYSPIMHGMLLFDHENNQVVVKGFINWSVLYFSLLWLGGVCVGGIVNFPETTLFSLIFILVFVLLMGFLYWIQYDRFTKVATFAAQEWTRRYKINGNGA